MKEADRLRKLVVDLAEENAGIKKKLVAARKRTKEARSEAACVKANYTNLKMANDDLRTLLAANKANMGALTDRIDDVAEYINSNFIGKGDIFTVKQQFFCALVEYLKHGETGCSNANTAGVPCSKRWGVDFTRW